MNRLLPSMLICGLSLSCTVTAVSQDTETTTKTNKTIRVATALNHLTVLEFQEPVTLVAAGGTDFQIERQENKVFVKPMKSGVSTNLFVWTASHRFNYELEPAGEVKDMNFAIDNSATAANPPVDPQVQLEQLADMMLTASLPGCRTDRQRSDFAGEERRSRAHRTSVSYEEHPLCSLFRRESRQNSLSRRRSQRLSVAGERFIDLFACP